MEDHALKSAVAVTVSVQETSSISEENPHRTQAKDPRSQAPYVLSTTGSDTFIGKPVGEVGIPASVILGDKEDMLAYAVSARHRRICVMRKLGPVGVWALPGTYMRYVICKRERTSARRTRARMRSKAVSKFTYTAIASGDSGATAAESRRSHLVVAVEQSVHACIASTYHNACAVNGA